MKKHLIVIGTAVLFLVVGLSGCIDINEDIPLPSETVDLSNTIVGTWYKTPNTWIGREHLLSYTDYITFSSDGTFDTQRREGTTHNYHGIYKLNEPEGDSKYHKLELTYYSYDSDVLLKPYTCNLKFCQYEQTEASPIQNKYKLTSA